MTYMTNPTLMNVKGIVPQRNTIGLLISLGLMMALLMQISLSFAVSLANDNFGHNSSDNLHKYVNLSLNDSPDYSKSNSILAR